MSESGRGVAERCEEAGERGGVAQMAQRRWEVETSLHSQLAIALGPPTNSSKTMSLTCPGMINPQNLSI